MYNNSINHGNSSEIPNSSEQPNDKRVDRLPPSGWRGECSHSGSEWREVIVLTDFNIVVRGPSDWHVRNIFHYIDVYKFRERPIETEQQKADREVKFLKKKIYNDYILPTKPKLREEMLSDIVDLLSTGLAGYRLVKEGE